MKSSYIRAVLAAAAIVVGTDAGVASAQQPGEYRGTLDPKLVAHVPPWYVLSKLAVATDEERGRVKVAIAASDKVSVVDLSPPIKGMTLKAALIERATGQFALLVDLNGDGAWTENESAPLSQTPDDPLDAGTALVGNFEVPLPAGYAFPTYPLMMMVDRLERKDQPPRTMLMQSSGVALRGFVDIGGHRTLVKYTSVNLRTGAVDPAQGRLEVDADGNGAIDTAWSSVENVIASGQPIVFRVGSHYVSTTSVDSASRAIVMRDHPASDYDRIELRIGAEIPDFPFTDFDGKPHKLSEFRGKYLMLDFWGSWCGPCISRFPGLKQTYVKYHDKGFEILGMDQENWEGDQAVPAIEKAQKVIVEQALPWPQTRPDTVKDTIRRFHIVPYPTYVLLDPQGKIVSFGGKGHMPLDGPELATTLEKLLKK